MTALFVYGTLRHLPLLEQVVGHPVAPGQVARAVLPGHLARWAEGQAFPILVEERGAQAEGLLLSGLNDAVQRLEGVDGIQTIRFNSSDVVRHPLVGRIVDAYEGARD